MKKLTRSLCLLLVFSIVMSFFVVGASASNIEKFTDASEVDPQYAEAANLLVGMGIIIGDDTGALNPTDNVKRSEAAKIIAYTNLGNGAENYTVSGNPYSDVPASHWAAKYVAYGSDAGIINGRGDNSFDPDAEVTGYEYVKMLLVSLGYGVNGEYVGAQWKANVLRDATNLGLLIGVDPNAAATRQEIIQYTFNALQTDTVKYSILNGYASTGLTPLDKQGVKFNYEIYDEFGRFSYEWKRGANVVAGPYTVKGDYVTTEPFTARDLSSLLSNVTSYTVDYILNGVRVTNEVPYYGGYGVRTDVYIIPPTSTLNRHLRENNYDVYVVSVVEYLGQVTAEGKITIRSQAEYNYKTAGTYEEKTLAADTSKYEVGDYVICTVYDPQGEWTNASYGYTCEVLPTTPATDTLTIMDTYAADGFTGVVSKVTKSGTITINGTDYILSEAAMGYDVALLNSDNVNEYTWFVDSYGNVIGDALNTASIDLGEYVYINYVEAKYSLEGYHLKADVNYATTGEEAVIDLYGLVSTDKTNEITTFIVPINNNMRHIAITVSTADGSSKAGIVRHDADEFYRIKETSDGTYKLFTVNDVLKSYVNIGTEDDAQTITFEAAKKNNKKQDYGYITISDATEDLEQYSNLYYNADTKLIVDGEEIAIKDGLKIVTDPYANPALKILAVLDNAGAVTEMYVLDGHKYEAPVVEEKYGVVVMDVELDVIDFDNTDEEYYYAMVEGEFVKIRTTTPTLDYTTVTKPTLVKITFTNGRVTNVEEVTLENGVAIDLSSLSEAEIKQIIAPNADLYDGMTGNKVDPTDVIGKYNTLYVMGTDTKGSYVTAGIVTNEEQQAEPEDDTTEDPSEGDASSTEEEDPLAAVLEALKILAEYLNSAE